MWIMRRTDMRQGIIWNQLSTRVSRAAPWVVCARARESSLFAAGSFDVSVVTCKPIISDVAKAPMRDSCDFRWSSANVSSEFGALRMTKVSTLHFPGLDVEPLVQEISTCPSRRALEPIRAGRSFNGSRWSDRALKPIRAGPQDLQLFLFFLKETNLRQRTACGWPPAFSGQSSWTHRFRLQFFAGVAGLRASRALS